MARYCDHYIEKGTFFSTYRYCNITGEEKEVNNNYYNNYCSNYCNVGSCPLYSSTYGSSSGCFITTVACELLNKDDKDEILNKLRFLRDNVLQKNEEYYDILVDYDLIGPIIARKLKGDANGKIISGVVYRCVLVPLCELIKEKKYDEAVEKYYQMTLMFISYYGLKHVYKYIKEVNGYEFDPKTAGHGKKSLKM